MLSRYSKNKPIPSTSTRKSSPNTTNFSKGISTYKPNDLMGSDELRLAENVRFDRIGEYITRRGFSRLSEPIGKVSFIQNNAPDSKTIPIDQAKPFIFKMNKDAIIYSVKITLRKEVNNLPSTPCIAIKKGDDIVSTSCVNPESINKTSQEIEVIFNDCPKFHNQEDISFVIGLQGENQSDNISVLATSDNVIIVDVYSVSDGEITNIFEANINGESTILFVHNETLYRLQGDIPVVVRKLPAGVKKVRFCQNLNQIRYADGLEKPHLLDPANNWQDTEISTIDIEGGNTDLNVKVSNIMDGMADNLIYFDSEVDTKALWTYPYGYFHKSTPINSYDKFNRNFYQNFPAIQTGDPLTAMFNLGGVFYFMTRRSKYQMYAQTADNWTQSQSTAQNGTFSQESIVCDLNFAYYASDNGIYEFDGASERSLTESSIQNIYDNIKHKETIVLDLYKNRLYIFYSNNGEYNDSCLIYNTNLKVWESFDTNACVSATSGRQNKTNRLICGHSKIGMLMTADTGDYSDLGSPIKFNLETGYNHFGTTSQLKRIPMWRPEFATTTKLYSVKCGFALDFSDQVRYAFSVDLKNQRIRRDSYVWDNSFIPGLENTPTEISTIPQVYGEFYRCQIRYQHIAAFEPVNFKSHTLTVQTQRIR